MAIQDEAGQDEAKKREEYRAIISEGDGPDVNDLKQARFAARDKTAERWAGVLRISRRTGMSVHYVDRNYDRMVQEEQRLSVQDLSRIQSSSPAVAGAMKDPRTAPLFNEREEIDRFRRMELLDKTPIAIPWTEALMTERAQRRSESQFRKGYGFSEEAEEVENIRRRLTAQLTPKRMVTEQRFGPGGAELGVDPNAPPEPEDPQVTEKIKAFQDWAKKIPQIKKDMFERELARLREINAFVAREDKIGLWESIGRHDPMELLPFVGSLPEINKYAELLNAAWAQEQNQATEEQQQLLEEYGRIAETEERRGKKWYAYAGDIAVGLPSFIGELALTAGVYNGVKTLILKGGKEAAEGLLRRSVRAVLARGAALAVQAPIAGATRMTATSLRRQFTLGESGVEAWPKAYLDQIIELGTERLSGPMTDFGKRIYTEWAKREGKAATESAFRTALKKFFVGADRLQKIGVHGPLQEFLEERASNALKAMTGLESWEGLLGAQPGAELLTFSLIPAGSATIDFATRKRGTVQNPVPPEIVAETAKAIGEMAKASPLASQPEILEEAVKKTVGDGNVYIPLPAFKQKHLAQGADPRSKAAELKAAESYDEAQVTGIIAIPKAAFYSRAMTSIDAAFYADEVRILPGSQNAREAREEREKLKKEAPAKEKDAAAEVSPIEASATRVSENIAAQLKRTGRYTDEQIKTYVKTIIEPAFTNFARDSGLTPEEIEAQFPVEIQLAENAGAELGQPLRALHEGDEVTLPAIKGESERRGFVEAIQGDQVRVRTADGNEALTFERSELRALPRQYRQPDEISPIDGGPIFKQYKDNVQGAIEALKAAKGGEARDALHHPDVGYFDLIYGAEKKTKGKSYGLAKLLKWHPEVLGDLQGFINTLKKDEARSTGNTIQLSSADGRAGVRLDYFGKPQKWLVTAFRIDPTYDANKKGPASPSTTIDTAERLPEGGQRDDTARPPQVGPEDPTIPPTDLETDSNEYEQKTYGKGGRAGYTPKEETDRGVAQVNLKAVSDLTSFFHEFAGHHYLEVIVGLSALPKASPRLKKQVETIFKWFGIKDKAEWDALGFEGRRKYHEQFAEAFEEYFLRGQAPSLRLRELFQTVRSWFIAVYKMLKGQVELPQDVIEVFDRILASDAEIAEMKEEQSHAVLKDAMLESGMPEELAQEYSSTIDKGNAVTNERMDAAFLADFNKAQTRDWEEKRKEVREEVAREVDKLPEYIAESVLKFGTLPNGKAVPEALGGLKLNIEGLRERYGKVVEQSIPAEMKSKEGGADADYAASILGMTSGEQLVTLLGQMENRNSLIDRLTLERMAERFPPAELESLPDSTLVALHNEHNAKRLRMELDWLMSEEFATFKKLVRKIAGKVPSDAEIRADAIETLSRDKTYGTLNPDIYRKASATAAKEALELFLKGDYQGAFEAKRRELVNSERHTVAVELKKKMRDGLDYLRGFNRTSKQEKIAKAGTEFYTQIEALRERYNLRPTSMPKLSERIGALREFYDQQRALGFEPAIDPVLFLETRAKNWNDVPIEEFLGIVDAVASIEHLATQQGLLQGLRERVAFTEAIEKLAATAEKNRPLAGEQTDPFLRDWMDRFKNGLVGADLSLVPMESLIEILDGGPVGPWHDYFWNRASTAQSGFLDDSKAIQDVLVKQFEAYRKADPARLTDMIETPLGAMTRGKLMSIAFNVGNESSFDKLIRGEGWDGKEALVMQSIGLLDKRDLDYIQETWDSINVLFPKLAALQERIGGVPLEKIEARPFTVQFRNGSTLRMKGGYWPAAYDARRTDVGQQQEAKILEGLTDTGYVPASIPSSARKQRSGYAGPMLLDFTEVIQRHLTGVLKDLNYREFLIDAVRILKHPQIRKVLQERLGTRYESAMIGTQGNPGWLRHVANEHVRPPHGDFYDRVAEKARSNITVVALGFKFTSTLAQLAGLSNSIDYIRENYGVKFMWEASKQFYANPLKMIEEIKAKSGEMRHRFDTMDRDMLRTAMDIKESKYSKGKEYLARASMYGINFMDRLVSAPTWLAAYNGSLAKGATEEQAIHAGDAAVRRSQGAGAAKDLSSIQRKRGVARIFTMFMTPFMAQYGQLRKVAAGFRKHGLAYTPEAIVRVALISILPKLLSEILSGRWPFGGDDEKKPSVAKWAIVKGLSSLVGPIPWARDLAAGAEKYVLGEGPGDIRYSPVFDALEKTWKSAERAIDATFTDKEWNDELGWDLFKNAGYIFGIPTDQASISGEYLVDLMNGEADPDGTGDFLHDLLYRRTVDERRGVR